MNQLFDTNHAAEGDFFYGRKKELEFFQKELFEPACRGISKYYSLTGMNRIGKSSLFKELCRRFRQTDHPNVYLIEASLEKISSFWQFWIKQVLRPLFSQPGFAEALSQIDSEDACLVEECRAYFFRQDNWRLLLEGDVVQDMIAKDYLEQLFPILSDAGQSVILIIDEFDRAGNVFGMKEENFGWFRGLLQDNTGLSVATLSRRSIRFIETNCFGGSTFDGIFSKRGLFGYSNSEMDAYFTLLAEHGLALDAQKRQDIWYYCGRSPYYLAIMGQALLNNPAVPPDAVASQFFDSFEAILSLLKEENLLTSMLQMFVGPKYNMGEAEIQKLVAMGYCMKRTTLSLDSREKSEYTDYCAPEQTGEYLTVCGYFIDYLNETHQTEVDEIWPKLTFTERKIRKIIAVEYEQLYPDDWKEQLQSIALQGGQRNFQTVFLHNHDRIYQRAGEAQRKNVGNSILNVVSLKTLGYMIQSQWGSFQKYFPCDSQTFTANMDTLYEARNPISHSNGELLSPADISAVEQICTLFITSIDQAAAPAGQQP